MGSQVLFTGQVDHRYAWIGNEARGGVDILAELATWLGTASASVAVSTMTFNYGTGPTATPADAKVEAIAALLAQKAAAGLDVRLFGNGGHRYQAGYFRAQRGPVFVADNNLSALVHRISFQRAATPAPPGFLTDSGAVFGPRGGGLSYGWSQDVTADVGLHGTPEASFTSPVLRECYAASNSAGPRTWSIALPPGFYYVLAVTGEAAYGSKSFVLAQGQTIFLRKDSSGSYQYFENTNTGPGEFACSTVDGGSDPGTGLPLARRLEVTAAGGQLQLTVGKAGQTGYSSLDYLEIYRASATHPLGDPGLDKTRVQERALHHSKFVLVDAATAPRLWTGSHNLTPVDPAVSPTRSEDAFLTEEAGICAAFRDEFNQWWGTTSGAPNAASSRNGVFKVPVKADGSMPSAMSGLTAAWSVRFSPSTTAAPGVNLYDTVTGFLSPAAAATEDVLLLMEQVTDGGTYTGSNGTFPGAVGIVTLLRNKALGGTLVRGMIGDTSPVESIFTSLAGIGTARIASLGTVHDKAALVDTLRDNPTRARGKVLFGSMNFSQGAMHVNNEQTLILQDPALANQFLQRAAAAAGEAVIPFDRAADCVLVLDRSYSMTVAATAGATKITAARLAAQVFVDMLEQDGTHRLALVRFGSSVEPFVPPSTLAPLTAASALTAKAAIDTTEATLPIGMSTCYGLALQEAQSLITSVATPHPRRVIVFLTDGMENTPPMASTVYPALAAAGVELHTTSFGAFPSADESGPNAILAAMARASGGTFAQVDDDAVHLQKRFAEVARDAMSMVTILDPSWTLAPGASFAQEFPVDMKRGTLVLVVLWGGQPVGPEALTVTAPWGAKLTPRSLGIERRTGDGREVWRIDLGRVGRGPKHELRGTWRVSGRASRKGESPLRVELCVFASDTGVVRLATELEGRAKGGLDLHVCPFGKERAVRDARVKVLHTPPGRKARTPSELRISSGGAKGSRLHGVQLARIPKLSPGVHEARVVVEGKVPIEAEVTKGRAAPALSAVPFRREQVIRWLVPGKPKDG